MKAKINSEKCIGCGACAAICPEAFEIKDDKARAKAKESAKPCVKQAVDACPVQAITLE